MIPGPRGLYLPRNVKQREYPPNAFNRAIDEECELWSRINQCGGLMAICPGAKYSAPPWVRMPAQGKRFSKINSVSYTTDVQPVPDTDVLVTSFRVPNGYDGCIVGTVNMYTGTGFADGSGDLTWRIQINRRFVKDYGAITTTIGSLAIPYTVNAGQILLQSGQLVQYFVDVDAAGTGNLNGGRVICAMFGWYWPR